MTNSTIKHVIGLAVAACTTLVIFSQVASLADHDRAELVAAKSAPAKVAANSAPAVR
jgi:hypothetical protein